MRIADRLAAPLAPDVDVGHAGVEGARTNERVYRDQVVEAVAAHGPQLVGGQARLELEDARRRPAGEHLVDLGVLEAQLVPVDLDPMPLANRGHGVVDHGERSQAQEVELQHPGLFQALHVVLGDHQVAVLGLAAAPSGRRGHDGYVIGQRPRGDDDAGRVHRGVAGQPFQRRGVVEQLFVARIFFVEPFQFLDPFHRLAHADGIAGSARDQLGDPVRLRRSEAQRAAHIADHGPRLHRPEGHDLSDRVGAVLRPHVVDDLAAALVAEVHVDVGRRYAVGVEEALE